MNTIFFFWKFKKDYKRGQNSPKNECPIYQKNVTDTCREQADNSYLQFEHLFKIWQMGAIIVDSSFLKKLLLPFL